MYISDTHHNVNWHTELCLPDLMKSIFDDFAAEMQLLVFTLASLELYAQVGDYLGALLFCSQDFVQNPPLQVRDF